MSDQKRDVTVHSVPFVGLNIGAGATRIEGLVNIDVSGAADVTLDLSRDHLPFADDSVDLVFSYHTLEHVEDYLFALGEIHRVLRHGGTLLLGLPHVGSTMYHQVNPYHLHDFNEYHFDLFDPTRHKGSAVEQNDILFQQVFTRLHYIGMFNLVTPPLRGWCRAHLLNVVRKFDVGLRAIKNGDVSELPRPTRACRMEMRREFDRYLNSRVSYDSAPGRARPGRARGTSVAVLRKLRRWWNGL